MAEYNRSPSESSGRINPYRLFVGSFIPNCLLKRPEISANAKLIYARLCQYAGRDGAAFPKIETICEEVGLEERTVERAIAELKEQHLITTIRRGLQRSNVYHFLDHKWLSAALDPTSVSDQEAPPVADQEPTPMSDPLKSKRINLIESVKIEETTVEVLPPNWPDCLDSHTWAEFKKMRQQIRKPLTKHAEMLLLKDLVKLMDDGQNANMVVEQSIKHSWQGLFPIREQTGRRNGYTPMSYIGAKAELTRRVTDRAIHQGLDKEPNLVGTIFDLEE